MRESLLSGQTPGHAADYSKGSRVLPAADVSSLGIPRNDAMR